VFNPAVLKLVPFYCSKCRKNVKNWNIAEAVSSIGIPSYGTRIPVKQHNFPAHVGAAQCLTADSI